MILSSLLLLISLPITIHSFSPFISLSSRDHHSSHHSHHSNSPHNLATITFYGAASERSSLTNPACYSGSGSNSYKVNGHLRQPSPNDMIAAVHLASNIASCKDYIKLQYKGKSVIVKIIDDCATCIGNWFDVSPKVFAALGVDQNIGIIHDVLWSKVKSPHSNNMPEN